MIFMELGTDGSLVRLMASTVGVLLLVLTIMLAADYHLRPGSSAGEPSPLATAPMSGSGSPGG